MINAKRYIHEFLFIFSIGMTLVMLAYSTSEIYPAPYCLICAAISLLNTQYAACALVKANQ